MIPWLQIQNTEKTWKTAKCDSCTIYVHIWAVMTATVKIGFWAKVQTNLSELCHNLHAMQRTWYWGDCKLSSECFWQLIDERWVTNLTIWGLLAKIENCDTHHMSNVRWCRRKGPYGKILTFKKHFPSFSFVHSHEPECLVHQKNYFFLANQSLWGCNAAFIHHSFKVSVIKLQFILQSFQKYNSQYEIGTSGNRSTNLSRYSQMISFEIFTNNIRWGRQQLIS